MQNKHESFSVQAPDMNRRSALAALTATNKSLALYDPAPHAALALAPGAWKGTLTYRDWTNPEKMVTLPCKLTVSLAAPDSIALFYIFDDGPGKIVY